MKVLTDYTDNKEIKENYIHVILWSQLTRQEYLLSVVYPRSASYYKADAFEAMLLL